MKPQAIGVEEKIAEQGSPEDLPEMRKTAVYVPQCLKNMPLMEAIVRFEESGGLGKP